MEEPNVLRSGRAMQEQFEPARCLDPQLRRRSQGLSDRRQVLVRYLSTRSRMTRASPASACDCDRERGRVRPGLRACESVDHFARGWDCRLETALRTQTRDVKLRPLSSTVPHGKINVFLTEVHML